MKRTIYFILTICLALPFVCHSQNQYYFNEGDTIYGRDTTYHYEWWSDLWLASSPMNKIILRPESGPGFYIHGRVLQYNFTDHPLNVVGIATSIYGYNGNFYQPSDSTPDRQEYVLLYEADTSRQQFYEIGRLLIDFTTPARYMNVEQRGNIENLLCCNIAPDSSRVIKIREYYFDKPLTVRDSFYVGHTTNNNYWPDPELTGSWNWGVACWAYQYASSSSRLNNCPSNESSCDTLPFQQIKFKQDDFMLFNGSIDSSRWYYFRAPELLIEFPIIEIDSSFYDGPPQYVCPQVQNFRIAQAAEGTVVFLWDTHGDHQRWQMSYGPAGTGPEDGTIVNCPIQVGQIMGLDTCTDYVAYIRAVCNHDSIVYSEWSAPLAFNICDTTGGGTAAIEGGMGQYIQLFPSPATDQVQLMSSFELRSIEVYDLQGRTLLNIPCEGHTAAFDVAGWPKGMYVAIVRTSAGNFAKKIMVKP